MDPLLASLVVRALDHTAEHTGPRVVRFALVDPYREVLSATERTSNASCESRESLR